MQKNVLEYFESSVVQHDNKTAIIDGEKSITFGELWGYSRRLAFRIKQTKDKVNQPIAVFLPKSGDSIIAFMGILCSGNIYVPMDTKSPPARVRSIVENLENPIIITSDEYSGAVYTTCPVIGNHHSGLVETDVPELETA